MDGGILNMDMKERYIPYWTITAVPPVNTKRKISDMRFSPFIM